MGECNNDDIQYERNMGQFLKGMKYFLMKLVPFLLFYLFKIPLISYFMSILKQRLKEINKSNAKMLWQVVRLLAHDTLYTTGENQCKSLILTFR